MNQIVKANPLGMVPFDPAKLQAAMQRVRRESDVSASMFLKMEKSGAWVAGVNAEPIDEAAEFYIVPTSFRHGYVAWGSGNTGEKFGEVMGPIEEVVPELPPLKPGSDGWDRQLGVGLVPVGPGTPLVFATTSRGGKELIDSLFDAVAPQLTGPKPVPVVRLDCDFYVHKKYGKVYTPLMPIVRWVSWAELQSAINGERVGPAAKAKPAAKAAPARKNGRR